MFVILARVGVLIDWFTVYRLVWPEPTSVFIVRLYSEDILSSYRVQAT